MDGERRFDTIASGLYLEGLAVDARRDLLWYSDVVGGGVHAVRPDGAPVCSLNPGRKWTGGVMMNRDGAVLSTGEGGIMWNDPDSGRSGWLIEQIDGAPINGVNELAPDGAGGIIFGTSDIERVARGGAPRPTALYHLSRERALTRLAEGIGFTNGIGHDAARRRLFCNDTFHGTWAFDMSDGPVLTGRRLLVAKEDADGLALDADGNAWITGFRSGAILRLAPDGMPLDPFETPAAAITQLRFGGVDLRDLYFNAVPADGGEALKAGRAIDTRDSRLYRTRSPLPGMAIPSAAFALG